MFKLASHPTDAIAILEESAHLYRETFSFTIFYSTIIAVLLSLPFFFISSPHWFQYPHVSLLIIASLIAFIFSNALLFHLYCYCSNVPSNMFYSLKQTFIKSPALLFLMFTYVLIVLSGAILFIIPGIIFAYSLLFSFVFALTENQTTLQTLMNSHQLVWRHWRHTFFTMSTPLLLNIVISLIFFVAIAEYSILMKIPSQTIGKIIALVNIVIQALFIPYLLSVTIVLLHDLRLRKSLASPPWN